MTVTTNARSIPDANRLIYALDGMSRDEAIHQVRRLSDIIKVYKIGLGLLYRWGLNIAKELSNAGNGGKIEVFVDMKAYDIPETVLDAIEAIRESAADAVIIATISAQGLDPRRLADEMAKKAYHFELYAVTLLTSQSEADLKDMGISKSVDDYVLFMAERARKLGCDGVVCSGHEARRVKRELGADFRVITPGIRLADAVVENDDQKRTVTPRQAILNGADRIVVGRPIRLHTETQQRVVAQAIQDEIQRALKEKGFQDNSASKQPFGLTGVAL
jgi:orotidine-5'-phosphate decarboxylase